MKLTAEEVKKIAALARIGLSEKEITKFQAELSTVIDFNADKLSQITKTVTLAPRVLKNLGQDDDPRPSLSQEDALGNAPKHKNGFFVVPKVLGE